MIVKNLGAGVFSIRAQNGNDLFNLAPEVSALIRRQKAALIEVDLTSLSTLNADEAQGLADARSLARERGKSFKIKIPEALKGVKLL